MKLRRFTFLLPVLLLAVSLAACGDPTATVTPITTTASKPAAGLISNIPTSTTNVPASASTGFPATTAPVKISTTGSTTAPVTNSPASQTITASMKLYTTIPGEIGHSSYVRALAFSPDGSKIASGSEDGILKFWDVKFGDEITSLKEHTTRNQFPGISSARFLPVKRW